MDLPFFILLKRNKLLKVIYLYLVNAVEMKSPCQISFKISIERYFIGRNICLQNLILKHNLVGENVKTYFLRIVLKEGKGVS